MIHMQIKEPKELSKDVQNLYVNTGTCLPECQGVSSRVHMTLRNKLLLHTFRSPFLESHGDFD